MGLLELSQEIYKQKQQQLEELGLNHDGYTLEDLFSSACGDIFKWSDILFFIGVIHYQLGEYQTAIKYFQESLNEKKTNNTLVSLWPYLSEQLGREGDHEDDCVFGELEALFQNRIYCKEEVEYNIGVCYYMLKEYKQAYHYLQDYPNFLVLIKKALNPGKDAVVEKQKRNGQEESEEYSQKEWSENGQEWEAEEGGSIDITPFPTHNRLCSIYQAKKIGINAIIQTSSNSTFLSACPKSNYPSQGYSLLASYRWVAVLLTTQ